MPYTSPLGSMPVINDSNAHTFIDPVVDGERRMCSLQPRDLHKHPYGDRTMAAIKPLPTFSKGEIIQRIRDREANRSGLASILDRKGVHVKNQNGTNYCWIYSVVHAVEIAYAVQGDGFVPLSATGAGSLITGGRNRGGYGAEGIAFMTRTGTCREVDWREHQIAVRNKPANFETIAKQSIITDWGELPSGNLDQLASAVLHNYPVTIGLPWWRHQVTIIDLAILQGNEIGFVFANSWGQRWGENGRGVLVPSRARGDMFYPISVRPRIEDFANRRF